MIAERVNNFVIGRIKENIINITFKSLSNNNFDKKSNEKILLTYVIHYKNIDQRHCMNTEIQIQNFN